MTTMTAPPPTDRALIHALYRLSRTLTGPDTVTVSLGAHGGLGALRPALLTLATALPDLVDDDLQADVDTVVAAYTAGITAAERARAWDSLTEAVQLGTAWDADGAADVLADPLPYGTSAEGTTRAAIDSYEAQREDALDALTAAPAVVWAAA